MFSVSCVGDTSGVLEHYTVLSHIGIGADLFHDYVGVSDSINLPQLRSPKLTLNITLGIDKIRQEESGYDFNIKLEKYIWFAVCMQGF